MHFYPKKPKSSFISCFFLICIASSVQSEEVKSNRSITISSSGQISAIPDVAKVQSGVVTEDISAQKALSKNNETLQNLIDKIKSGGIESNDIRTTTFQVEPRYTSPREGNSPIINGYRVVNQIEIIVRDLKSIGDLLDRLVSLGANQIGGLTFEVSMTEKLKDTARKEAVNNARRRAELYASATNSKLGKVLLISENDVSSPQPFLRAARAAVGDAVPIEKGAVALEANVTITWELE